MDIRLQVNYFFSRKYSARIQEQEEHIETLLVKVNNLEKQKSRLQSEVEVLIIDLEKVNIYWLILISIHVRVKEHDNFCFLG